MAKPKVSADIESICGKCGDVWHVVVAMVGDKVAKVQCKQCLNVHRHKPPGGPEAKGPAAPRVRSATASKTAKAASKAAVPSEDTPLVSADLSRPPRVYKASESYQPGDRLNHPTFGGGVVEASAGPGKVQVWFAGGRKILAQARGESSLAPPPRAQQSASDED